MKNKAASHIDTAGTILGFLPADDLNFVVSTKWDFPRNFPQLVRANIRAWINESSREVEAKTGSNESYIVYLPVFIFAD